MFTLNEWLGNITLMFSSSNDCLNPLLGYPTKQVFYYNNNICVDMTEDFGFVGTKLWLRMFGYDGSPECKSKCDDVLTLSSFFGSYWAKGILA